VASISIYRHEDLFKVLGLDVDAAWLGRKPEERGR